MVTTATQKTNLIGLNSSVSRVRSPRSEPASDRPAIQPLKNYTRQEAAQIVPCAQITLIRAYDAGHLKAYRVGRKILHSGQHLIDWLEAGGKTGRVGNVIGEEASR